MALPTLVIAGSPELGRRVVGLLAQLSIVDVDVACDFVEGHQRTTERDYSAIVLAGQPARRFGFQRFCAAFGGQPGQMPGIIQVTDGPNEELPCAGLPAFRLEPDFTTDDLRRAIWTAVERSGRGCKSAGLCGLRSCTLDPSSRMSH